MNTLTFDTCLDSMYITLSQDKDNIASKIVHTDKEKYHSAYIIPTIIELLKEQQLTMQDISAIGVNVGPGSFTGIRACVTVARVCAQMLDIPAIGISSLEILSRINKTEKKSLCLLDARKNKAYIAIYSASGDSILEPQAMELEEAVSKAKEEDFFIITDSKMQNFLKEYDLDSTNYQDGEYNFGINLAEIVLEYLQKSMDYNWASLKPLYIQPPPISMPKKYKL